MESWKFWYKVILHPQKLGHIHPDVTALLDVEKSVWLMAIWSFHWLCSVSFIHTYLSIHPCTVSMSILSGWLAGHLSELG